MAKKPSSLSAESAARTYNPNLSNLLKDVGHKEEEGNIVRMNFEVSEDLRNEFKAKIAKQGKRVKDVFSSFMREYIKKEI